jgi:hypothetical protein
MLILFLLPLIALTPRAVTSSDPSFISGFADTIQYFSTAQQKQQHDSSEQRSNQVFVKRHHLICMHKGPFRYNKIGGGSSEKCCNDLWSKGLIQSHHRQYCYDHVAMLPDVPSPGGAIETVIQGVSIPRTDVRPIFYVAIDEEIPQNDEVITSATYRQLRSVMARDEHKERENVRDLPNHGVEAYSPFHLAGFMPEGRDVLQYYGQADDEISRVSLMIGKVNGTLYSEGGMHRAFQQSVTIAADRISLLHTAPLADMGIYVLNIRATVFLPLSESVFIDADDPFLVEYDDSSPDAIMCRASLLNYTSYKDQIAVASPECNIAFVSLETIDIEQPSFASRQHVVAFQIEASMELTVSSPAEVLQNVNIGVDYGTMLHIRYLMPISKRNDGGVSSVFDGTDGLVPIAIQQPILYSGSMTLISKGSNSFRQHFVLDTTASAQTRQSPKHALDPIVINVAVGIDDDYWWVTSVTMLSALIGGFIIMRSIDSASIWC